MLSKIVLCFSCGRFSCRKFKGHLPPSYLVDQLRLSRVSEKHACPNMSPWRQRRASGKLIIEQLHPQAGGRYHVEKLISFGNIYVVTLFMSAWAQGCFNGRKPHRSNPFVVSCIVRSEVVLCVTLVKKVLAGLVANGFTDLYGVHEEWFEDKKKCLYIQYIKRVGLFALSVSLKQGSMAFVRGQPFRYYLEYTDILVCETTKKVITW